MFLDTTLHTQIDRVEWAKGQSALEFWRQSRKEVTGLGVQEHMQMSMELVHLQQGCLLEIDRNPRVTSNFLVVIFLVHF
jgi:hypothetical protein